MREILRGFFKLGRVEAVGVDEGLDFCPALRSIHPSTIPLRESRSFDHGVERQRTEGISITEAQETLAIDLLRFGAVQVAVEVFDGFHGR